MWEQEKYTEFRDFRVDYFINELDDKTLRLLYVYSRAKSVQYTHSQLTGNGRNIVT